jgi:hypothetical protein
MVLGYAPGSAGGRAWLAAMVPNIYQAISA